MIDYWKRGLQRPDSTLYTCPIVIGKFRQLLVSYCKIIGAKGALVAQRKRASCVSVCLVDLGGHVRLVCKILQPIIYTRQR